MYARNSPRITRPGFCATSPKLECGYTSALAPTTVSNSTMNIAPSVRSAISKTSHTLHTGFSPCMGIAGTGATITEEVRPGSISVNAGSVRTGSGRSGWALAGGRSNCGLAEGDKELLRQLTLGNGPLLFQNIPPAPAPYTTSSLAPLSPACPAPQFARPLRRLPARD